MLRRYEASKGQVTAIDVRGDGRLILAAVVSPPPANEGEAAPAEPPVTTIHLWDAVTAQEVAHWQIDEMIADVAFVHSGMQFIAAGSSLRIFTIPQSVDAAVRRR